MIQLNLWIPLALFPVIEDFYAKLKKCRMKDKPLEVVPITRRSFFKNTGMLAAAAVSLPLLRTKEVLRPPGAASDFLSRCIRCGMCIEACPYDSIRFLKAGSGLNIYTPYIDPVKTPCYLCRTTEPDGKSKPLGKLLRCGEACPTGALKPILNEIEVLSSLSKEMKTGTAILNRKICVAWQFNFCGVCYFNCPLKDKALLSRPPDEEISRNGILTYVDQKACIGCGRCVYVCPVRKYNAKYLNKTNIPDYFQLRYGALVQRIIAINADNIELPAIRVLKNKSDR